MAHKECIFKRIWNRVFHKTKMLPAPLQYTKKEVKLKLYEILQFLVEGTDIKNKCAESIDNSIQSLNIYFYDEGETEIENEFNTYMHTVCKKEIRLKGDSKILFNNPVMKSGILLEVFPVLNLARCSRDKYYMNIYYNAVKLFSKYSTNKKKISKNTSKVFMYNGINSKEVIIYSDEIASIRNERYYILDRTFSYIIAQILYEAIECKPFLFETTREEEKVIKIVKYYISKGYRNYRDFIVDYLGCKRNDIENKIVKNSDVTSLKDLEKKIRKSFEK